MWEDWKIGRCQSQVPEVGQLTDNLVMSPEQRVMGPDPAN